MTMAGRVRRRVVRAVSQRPKRDSIGFHVQNRRGSKGAVILDAAADPHVAHVRPNTIVNGVVPSAHPNGQIYRPCQVRRRS